MDKQSKVAESSWENLLRIFTVPEAPGSTLNRLDRDISANLAGFLQEHIVAEENDLVRIERDFNETRIPEAPVFVSDQTRFLLDKVVAQSVHTASPSFVGHMTSALPYFMIPLSKIMIALNQNLVKTETSKAFTPLERQVLGMLHRLIYGQPGDFYDSWLHHSDERLGAFCSGGTVANITALWAARNRAFGPDGEFPGIGHSGVFSAMRHYDCDGAAVLVSERGHYSLSKAADVLGIGRDQMVAVETDGHNRVRPDALVATLKRLARQRIRPFALVGIAGTTETGNIDPLDSLADIAAEQGIHFHVDAAWGGPTLFSERYRPRLAGIERADSVTIDAHKQLYVPMGAGMVLFREPSALGSIEHHAQYIIRQGSKDLGSTTLEGSRPGMAMLVQSALKIIGRQGYAMLIDNGIQLARRFADRIAALDDFELITKPELNILTYRWAPADAQALLGEADSTLRQRINDLLNRMTQSIQKTQRERGKTFVSRTRLTPAHYDHQAITVFRVVLANPLTTDQVLRELIEEQRQIAGENLDSADFAELKDLLDTRSGETWSRERHYHGTTRPW
ncbi:pyridoxal-dependent aspartate 1-decarboxylase PanP [Halomonas stenophila]|uniref:Glutamate decarboxylase n=1 Tax=Halomonas stenophila TaxID=795312 RepID=A0A7W5EXE0_9GAMM|nr:putative pyridoxal-dependent aspartate 1-decarboxylase [Halomonas stenophila]MBB3232620.1 glutamate decarboxylase [Halomonas stenophila]